jgi:hypothetical protein
MFAGQMFEVKGDSGRCTICSGGAFCMSDDAVTFDGIDSAVVCWCVSHRCMTDWMEIVSGHVEDECRRWRGRKGQ